MVSHVKKVRLKARLSQTAAAALAKVSPHTWKLFEINEELVTSEKRSACEAVVPDLERLARESEAA